MTIQTKHSIGDTVCYLNKNSIRSAKVLQIEAKAFPHPKSGEAIASVDYFLDDAAGIKRSEAILFKTPEEVTKSLLANPTPERTTQTLPKGEGSSDKKEVAK